MKKYILPFVLCGLLLLVGLITACNLRPSTDTAPPADTAPATQAPPYTVTLVASLPEGYTLSGGNSVQTVTSRADFTPVTVSVEQDFRYDGYEIDGVIYKDSEIRLPHEITADVTVNLLISHLTD